MKLKKSHVILILIGILILLGSAVTVSLTKTPPHGFPTNPNLADWLFYILDDWASAGAPVIMLVGIFVALYIGLKSLSQTQASLKAQERERLLTELGNISGWAQSLIDFAIDRDDKLDSAKELQKLKTTGGSLKRGYSLVFSTIVDSEEKEMRDVFNSIDALIAFLSPQPTNTNGYTKATELENGLHVSANNILMKADNARAVLLG